MPVSKAVSILCNGSLHNMAATKPDSTLTKRQTKTLGPRFYLEGGTKYRITAKVRYDDQCGNGHNSFSITGEIDRQAGGRWVDDACGCIHKEISKHFPELSPYIKWHLTDSGGPMHYLSNTQYHAGDRDCHGLRKGERRQIINGRTGRPSWKLCEHDLPRYVDADECPTKTATLRYVPWERVGEGKERDLDAARRTAAWPDATDEQLTDPGLEERLKARLTALVDEFRQAVESLGFTF